MSDMSGKLSPRQAAKMLVIGLTRIGRKLWLAKHGGIWILPRRDIQVWIWTPLSSPLAASYLALTDSERRAIAKRHEVI